MKLLSLLLLAACHSPSVVELNMAEPLTACKVRVFLSKADAEKEGAIIERAIISGTSSPSMSHTVGTAINKHKDKACQYGADNVYVKDSTAADLGVASVTLVAFSFKKE